MAIVRPRRLADLLDLPLDLLVRLADLPLELQHLRIGGLVDLEIVLVLGLELRLRLLEHHDVLVFLHDREGIGVVLRLLEHHLGLDSVLLRLRDGGVVLRQVLAERVLLLVDVDDLELAGEAHQLTLGILELRLGLQQLLLEERLGVGRGLEAPLEVDVDEGLREGVHRLRGEERVGAVEVQTHEARAANRLDREGGLKGAHQGVVARRVHVLRRDTFPEAPEHLLERRGRRELDFGARRGFVVRCRKRALLQPDLLHRALGERTALEELVIGLVEILVVIVRVYRRDFLVVENARRIALDLDRRRRPVHGRRERRHHDGEQRRHREDDEDRPLALEDDAQEVAHMQRLLEAIRAGEARGQLG